MQLNESNDIDIQTKEILKYYHDLTDRSSQDTIVEMLRELQEVHGCISPAVRELAAQAAGVKASMVQAIVKRMPSLKQSPYVHEIILCTGGRCSSKGNLDLLTEVRQKLGVNGDGISKDGKVCLKTRACLKNCRTAPNVVIDGCLYSGKDADSIIKMVNVPLK